MRQHISPAVLLAERLCRPQRVGVFGHRGVGKTTLLTMLYREGVSGRLPDLRLAAADARTANYLSDKIHELEAGQPLPATLAETDLRFHLYHGPVRVELLMKDYQGEHVELGRGEPILDFLADCDAVWLCLDAAERIEQLRRQQEVEQLIEQYLTVEPKRVMDRPVAMVLTRSDLLGPNPDAVELKGRQFEMVRHALQLHCPHNGLFAVSCLTPVQDASDGKPKIKLQPRRLEDPLLWLAATMQAQDEARLDKLWEMTGDLTLLQRCVTCFARRYPDSPRVVEYQQRLQKMQRNRRRNRLLVTTSAVLGLVTALWAYDALGYHLAGRYAAEHASDPERTLARWESYQTWHPTRNLLILSSSTEASRMEALRGEVRRHKQGQQLAELRRQAADPDADPEAVWQQFQTFHSDYPEVDIEGELKSLRVALKARRDEHLNTRAQRAYDDLVTGETQTNDLLVLLGQADRFLRDFAGSPNESDVRRRRDGYLARLDDRDIEFARNYSAKQPLNFQTRRETYQKYLDRHPNGGFAPEARSSIETIEKDWDRHDFRGVRDHFLARPGEVQELVALCRAYLAAHPQGRFTESARELLRWSEKVTAPGEYKVTLRGADFEHKIARFFSRGPDLSVDVEVAGIRYGPSQIVVNRYDPDWDYEFPRPIKWRLGDAVRIRVTDHDWGARVVLEYASAEGDPLSIKMLSGENWQGKNMIKFESDFTMPKLPEIE